MKENNASNVKNFFNSAAFDNALQRDLAMGGLLWQEVFDENQWLWDPAQSKPHESAEMP